MDYTDTPIGRIPSDWTINKLGNKKVSTIIMGQSPPSSTYNKTRGLPFLQGKAEFGEINPIPNVCCDNPQKIAERNDILISVRAPVGDVNLADDVYCIGRGLAAIRTEKSYLNNNFLFYYLNQSKNRFESISMGSTFKAIRKGELEKFIIPIPPLPEQQKIAEILSTADQAIQKSTEIIAKTERLKKGMIQKLFTEGIGHVEFKNSPIGKIPLEWKILGLNSIGDFQYGYTTSAEEMDTGTKFLRITDIEKDGSINWEKVPYCHIDQEEFKKYELIPGDILFARIGATSGKTGFIDENKLKSVFASYLIRLKTKENFSSKFIFYYTQSPFYWSQVLRQREGQLKKGMNANMLSLLKVALPEDISEQEEIAEILSKIDELKFNEIKRKQKLQNIKKGLMNDLLTGRKRVKMSS